ncbi:Cytoplasmic GTPase/eEF2-like protein (ribosomal biogenesis) [Coemansia spiralis]|uniref:Ribosome assembly protein 1 n=2 Tax=Coemansia TaxID=4863 RepID=A0A9W8L034_9FUNG|nr:Cytoplasmic GTPase/eEF2-like protein (ribosomal biogenesis) [Coemansia umbellata]KAJ2623573.1 Cytoplasmic GTPase/eEF2-like protein (ribosomal biogenesis) [Coemansia sp. RSA 1358]KAJ2680243.1 Cytoplasmic GTPase/eEF2-like protein (ribosomal biogenesis) [Coemansia spiralis]
MPAIPPTKLAELQKSPQNIRNVCVLAHVDHGKTTLSDALLATNGIISTKLAGKVRYLDSREDEQERGITMESSGISLYYKVLRKNVEDAENTPSTQDSSGAVTSVEHNHGVSEYLINLIDSPGHIDFASEVASAARLSDGALVLVDAVEGVCTQTVSVLRQAWVETVKPVLFFNKIDRLIVEWQMSPAEAYMHIQQLIEQVNAVLAGFWEGDRLAEDSRKLEAAKEKWKETHGDDAPMTEWYLEEKDDSHIYFSPEQGNVLFGSAIDGWAFRVNHFAHLFAEKLGISSPAKLQPLMWGDYFIDPKNKRRVLNRKQYSKLYGAGKAAAAVPLFVQLCFTPIWQVYENIIIDYDQEKIEKVIATLGTKVLPRDLKSKDRRNLLTAIMQAWLPLAQTCMIAIVEMLPSPVAAQPLRLPPLMQDEAMPMSDRKDLEPRNKVEHALYACEAGSNDDLKPMVAYIGKIISVPREALPEFSKSQRDRRAWSADEMRALGREAVRREFALGSDSATATPRCESGEATPIHNDSNESEEVSADSLLTAMNEKLNIEPASTSNLPTETNENNATSGSLDSEAGEDEVLIGFGRIYSGTIRIGDTVWAMQPKYDAKSPNSQPYLKKITVNALYMLMGREFVCLQEVPAGNVFGIRGISGAILKSGTLASDALACPNLAAMHSETYPIVRVALEPVNPQEMSKLVRGLELLNQADPCVQIISQSTGERVLVTAGELHLERCLKDLRERFAQCEIHASEPIVPFREGIVRQNAQPRVILGEVGFSGQSLATVSMAGQENSDAAVNPEELRTKPVEGLQRGEVIVTTANGLATITLLVEPLPDRTTKLLQRHEQDIQRVVKLASSRRHNAMNSVSEALENAYTADIAPVSHEATSGGTSIDEDDEDDVDDGPGGEPRVPKPSRASELGPWLQNRLRTTFYRAKGWDPQRVQHLAEHGLRMFGPRRTGANVLIYSKDMLEQYSKPTSSWFNQQRRNRLQETSSTAATPMLSDGDESDSEHSSPPAISAGTTTNTSYTIYDFEEAVNTGFQLATQSGPLCLEPLVGVAVTIKNFVYNGTSASSENTGALSGQIITTIRDGVKMGFLHWSPRLHLAMYTCDIQATSEVLGKVYAVINRRHGRVLSEEMREGTPYFTIKASIPIVESFGFADEIRKRTSGAAIPLLIFRGFESLDVDPFWVPTTEEELEDLGEKADRDNEAKKYMDKVRKRKGLFIGRKIVEHAEKQRTLKK